MPKCPSYAEMDQLDELLKCHLQLPIVLTADEARLVMAIIADNRQMRRYIQKTKEDITKRDANIRQLKEELGHK